MTTFFSEWQSYGFFLVFGALRLGAQQAAFGLWYASLWCA